MDDKLTAAQPVALVDLGDNALNKAWQLARIYFKAGCFGGDVKSPEQALVKIQAGAEMGMTPMESMNSLYIVNGKISTWGAAGTKRLRENGWKLAYDEQLTQCTVTITKGEETYSYTATQAELQKLNSRAAGFALKDKLKWHAVGRLIRFYVPEIFGGVVTYLAEEAEEFRPVAQQAEQIEAPNFDSLIAEATTNEELKKLASDIQSAQGGHQIPQQEAKALLALLMERGKAIKRIDGQEKVALAEVAENLGVEKPEKDLFGTNINFAKASKKSNPITTEL